MHFEGNDLEVILDCVARRATHTKCYLQKSVYNDEKPIQYFDKISSLSLYAYPSGFIAFLSIVRKYFIFGIKCKLYFIVRFILLKPAPKKPRKKPEKPKQTNTKGAIPDWKRVNYIPKIISKKALGSAKLAIIMGRKGNERITLCVLPCKFAFHSCMPSSTVAPPPPSPPRIPVPSKRMEPSYATFSLFIVLEEPKQVTILPPPPKKDPLNVVVRSVAMVKTCTHMSHR